MFLIWIYTNYAVLTSVFLRMLITKFVLVFHRLMQKKVGLRMISTQRLALEHSIMRVSSTSSTLLTCSFYTPCPDDDYAVSVLADLLNKSSDAAFFRNRGVTNPFAIYNNDTGFMEARNANGSWAGPDAGWTEGDKWAYSFDVVQDVDRLIQVRGGKTAFVKSLDAHFDGGR